MISCVGNTDETTKTEMITVFFKVIIHCLFFSNEFESVMHVCQLKFTEVSRFQEKEGKITKSDP